MHRENRIEVDFFLYSDVVDVGSVLLLDKEKEALVFLLSLGSCVVGCQLDTPPHVFNAQFSSLMVNSVLITSFTLSSFKISMFLNVFLSAHC